MENHRFISKSDSAKARSNRKHIRQQKVHLNVQDSVHASVNPVSSHTEDDYNQPKTPPHSVHATVNRASHDAEDHYSSTASNKVVIRCAENITTAGNYEHKSILRFTTSNSGPPMMFVSNSRVVLELLYTGVKLTHI
ncbi:hypothetical protein JHK85_000610 [Glycine max]|nr:hypothetical protein JHK85_000610 [Glycine max]